VADDGTEYTPTELNNSQPNPFTLAPGAAWEVYVPAIPAAQLPEGRYAVVISSTAQIVAISNISGQGALNFNGSYSGFSAGAETFYLPGVNFNYYGWYSLLSVQNLDDAAADIDVEITCNDGTVGTMSATGVPSMAAHHFVLKNETPSGFTAATSCNGSAKITAGAGQMLVAVDNATAPAGGNTASYSGFATGAATMYVPGMYTDYYGWNGSINVRKLGAGNVTVTATYSDGAADSTCNLTDAAPTCLLYMPVTHAAKGYYGVTISSSPATELVVIANAANGQQAFTYNAIGSGAAAVGIPSTMKSYYGWNTSFTCQNVSATATTLEIAYDGYAANAYNTASLGQGDSVEVFQPGEAFLPNGHISGATVTANTAGAQVSCIVSFNNPTNMGANNGDWSMSYNAFDK
jgi:hypothetical protein